MDQQGRPCRLRAAAVVIMAVTLLATSCISVLASVSAATEESADFYPGNTGMTIPGFDESLSQHDSGTDGVATTSYNYPYSPGGPPLLPGAGVGVETVTADKGYSTYAYVNGPGGILKAYAATWLVVKGKRIPQININSHASAEAEITDTIVLSAPTTLVLAGSFDGDLGGSSNHPNYDVFEEYIWTPMSVDTWIKFSYDVPGEEGRVTQGYDTYYDSAGHASDSFSVLIDLPADTPIRVSAGLSIRTTVDPDTSGILGVSWQGTVDPTTAISGYIWADVANTMDFRIEVPGGITVTSQSGSLPLQTVPEPSALLALGSGLGLLATCFRRRH